MRLVRGKIGGMTAGGFLSSEVSGDVVVCVCAA